MIIIIIIIITEDETKSCNERVVKEMEIVHLKETNARQQKKTNDWYENET